MSQSPALFHTLQVAAGAYIPGFSPLVDLARRNLKADEKRTSQAINDYVRTIETLNNKMPDCARNENLFQTAAGCAAYRTHQARITCPNINDNNLRDLKHVANAIKCTCEQTQDIDLVAWKSCAAVLCNASDANVAVNTVTEMKQSGAHKCWAVYDDAEKFIKHSSAPGLRVSAKGAVVLALLVPALGVLGLGW